MNTKRLEFHFFARRRGAEDPQVVHADFDLQVVDEAELMANVHNRSTYSSERYDILSGKDGACFMSSHQWPLNEVERLLSWKDKDRWRWDANPLIKAYRAMHSERDWDALIMPGGSTSLRLQSSGNGAIECVEIDDERIQAFVDRVRRAAAGWLAVHQGSLTWRMFEPKAVVRIRASQSTSITIRIEQDVPEEELRSSDVITAFFQLGELKEARDFAATVARGLSRKVKDETEGSVVHRSWSSEVGVGLRLWSTLVDAFPQAVLGVADVAGDVAIQGALDMLDVDAKFAKWNPKGAAAMEEIRSLLNEWMVCWHRMQPGLGSAVFSLNPGAARRRALSMNEAVRALLAPKTRWPHDWQRPSVQEDEDVAKILKASMELLPTADRSFVEAWVALRNASGRQECHLPIVRMAGGPGGYPTHPAKRRWQDVTLPLLSQVTGMPEMPQVARLLEMGVEQRLAAVMPKSADGEGMMSAFVDGHVKAILYAAMEKGWDPRLISSMIAASATEQP